MRNKKFSQQLSFTIVIVLIIVFIIYFASSSMWISKPTPQWEQDIYRNAVSIVYPGVSYPESHHSDRSMAQHIVSKTVELWFPEIGYQEEQQDLAETMSKLYEQPIHSVLPIATETITVADREVTSEIQLHTAVPADTTPVPQPSVTVTPDVTAAVTAVDTTQNIIGASGKLGILPGQLKQAGITYSIDNIGDFDTILNQFYTLDSTTTISPDLLNPQVLLSKDLTLKHNDGPQILIYHTHSQEEFLDSNKGDPNTSIVGVGNYLAALLKNVYGYEVIHHTTSYDLKDGKVDRDDAYSNALGSIQQVLEDNPTIEVVIDLHRDGIAGDKMTTMINGQETAKLMFFNGLSRTVKNGEISYLKNPNLKDNLAFSLQMHLKALEYFPDVVRPIYLKGYRYNMHLKPRCLLVEAGSQKNTYQEVLNAMEVLAELLHMVLK